MVFILISVILPVYNGELFVSEAIESILNQDFKDFELICINDGSTDRTKEILDYYRNKDSRIIVIERENKGLIYSLNEGLDKASYDYIARMDADDIAFPERLSLQLEFLKKNPKIAVVGSRYQYINEKNEIIGIRKSPSQNSLLKMLLSFGSPFGHPTVMMNRSILGNDLYYDHKYKAAEDYELWLRLSKKYNFACLKKPLLLYRVLETSISRSQREVQLTSMVEAMMTHLFRSGVTNMMIRSFIDRKLSYLSSINLISKQNSNYFYRIGTMLMFSILILRR